jgi:hypothetical protein
VIEAGSVAMVFNSYGTTTITVLTVFSGDLRLANTVDGGGHVLRIDAQKNILMGMLDILQSRQHG